MDAHFPIIALPALLALVLKGAIFFLARRTGERNRGARVYIALLLAFSVHNLVEIAGLSG